jgi:agmatine/peptidylarginine deiminase
MNDFKKFLVKNLQKNSTRFYAKRNLPKRNFRVSGQFEKLSAVYLCLSDFDPIDPKKVEPYTNITTVKRYQSKLIKEISPYVRPVVIASSKEQLLEFVKTEKKNLADTKLYYYIIPHDDIWVRDTGAEWLVSQKEQIIVNHNFGLWGYIETKISGDWKFWDVPSNVPGGMKIFL